MCCQPKMKGYPGYPCASNKFNSLILNFNKRRCQIFGYGPPFQFKIFKYMKPTCTIGSIIEQKSTRKPESTNFMLSLNPSVNEFASTLNPGSVQSWRQIETSYKSSKIIQKILISIIFTDIKSFPPFFTVKIHQTRELPQDRHFHVACHYTWIPIGLLYV